MTAAVIPLLERRSFPFSRHAPNVETEKQSRRERKTKMTDITPTAAGPLDGVRVIDLSTVVMGPYAAQILGDLGADVIKIESPADTVRVGQYRTTPGMTALNLNVNRNKRSVALNLKDEDQREQALKLIDTADVLITNIRPGALSRLGLNYADV